MDEFVDAEEEANLYGELQSPLDFDSLFTWSNFRLLFVDCFLDIAWQFVLTVQYPFLLSLACQLLALISNNRTVLQLAHVFAGVAAILLAVNSSFLAVASLVFEAFVGYFLLWRYCSSMYAVLLFLIVYQAVGEYYLLPGEVWHSIRGCHMILQMKLISQVVDEKQQQSRPTILDCLAYWLTPCTVIYGPWISISAFEESFASQMSVRRIIFCVRQLILGLSCIFVSTCGISFLIIEEAWPAYVIAFRNSLSFYFSHFFISYISSAFVTVAGISRFAVVATDPHSDSPKFLKVSRPFDVIVPHSLTKLVIAWSLPMHYWLRRYVFQPIKASSSPLVAILATYAASSLLHGFNAQIAIVLLSVGLFTYAEFIFRARLAKIFDACVASRPCEDTYADHVCRHASDLDCWPVRSVNVALAFYAFGLFVYATASFDFSAEQQTGYSFSHLFNTWSQLGWLGHYVSFASFCIARYLI